MNDPFALARLEGDDADGGADTGWSRRPILFRCSAAAAPCGSRPAAAISPRRSRRTRRAAAECRIVVEAADLRCKVPLRDAVRALPERHRAACYADSERDRRG